MIQFLATTSMGGGYLPQDDEPPLFDTPREAWDYLAVERLTEENSDMTAEPEDDYTETYHRLSRYADGTETPGERSYLDSLLCGTVKGDTPGYDGNHDLGRVYSVTLVITDPSAAEVWPHVKPNLVMLGKGLKGHGTVGATTGCGKVWSTVTTRSDAFPADAIDCQRCVTAIDKQNAWNRKISYGASVSSEQDAFAGGAGEAATGWRADHYGRETIAEVARKTLKIIPTRPVKGRNR